MTNIEYQLPKDNSMCYVKRNGEYYLFEFNGKEYKLPMEYVSLEDEDTDWDFLDRTIDESVLSMDGYYPGDVIEWEYVSNYTVDQYHEDCDTAYDISNQNDTSTFDEAVKLLPKEAP